MRYSLQYYWRGERLSGRIQCSLLPNHYTSYLGSAKMAQSRRKNTKLAPLWHIWRRRGGASLRRPAQGWRKASAGAREPIYILILAGLLACARGGHWLGRAHKFPGWKLSGWAFGPWAEKLKKGGNKKHNFFKAIYTFWQGFFLLFLLSVIFIYLILVCALLEDCFILVKTSHEGFFYSPILAQFYPNRPAHGLGLAGLGFFDLSPA